MDPIRKGEFDAGDGYMQQIRICRSCGAEIVWVITPNLTRMPIDVASIIERDNKHYGLSHFATCPQAQKWRKR